MTRPNASQHPAQPPDETLQALESALAAPREVVVPSRFADKVMLRVELTPRPQRSWLLPSECIAPIVLGAVGIGVLAMQLQGAHWSYEGLTTTQWYMIATSVLLGIAPLWTGLRAVVRD